MKRHLNLLSPKLRRKALLQVRMRHWTQAWLVLAALAVLLGVRTWNNLALSRLEHDDWERRTAVFKMIDERNAERRRELNQLREREAGYGQIENAQLGFALLAAVSECSAATEGEHTVQEFTFKHTRVPIAPPPPAPGSPPVPAPTPAAAQAKPPKLRDVHTLSLRGVATSNLTVARFVTALRDSGMFQSVDLKSAQGHKGTAGLRMYQVECTF